MKSMKLKRFSVATCAFFLIFSLSVPQVSAASVTSEIPYVFEQINEEKAEEPAKTDKITLPQSGDVKLPQSGDVKLPQSGDVKLPQSGSPKIPPIIIGTMLMFPCLSVIFFKKFKRKMVENLDE